MAGCSPKQNSPAAQSSVPLPADLGKNEEYFKNLYGAPKSTKQVTELAFSFPGQGSMIHLARPFKVQDFESDKLKTTVVYSDSTQKAIWVKYTLPNPWTQEQINAALQAYGSNWKVVQQNFGMNFLLNDRAPVTYGSSTGCLACKTITGELIIYAPQLYLDLRGQIEEKERQKKAVPKF